MSELSPQKISILTFIATVGVASTRQVRGELFAGIADESCARKHLNELRQAQLINRVLYGIEGAQVAVYYSSRKGLAALAQATGDPAYFDKPVVVPAKNRLEHAVALTDLRLKITKDAAAQHVVTIARYLNEFDIKDAAASEPKDKYALYIDLSDVQPKLKCIPDGGVLLQAGAFRQAYFLELERENNPRSSAREKSPGYAALAGHALHRRVFPGALEEFRVLVVGKSVAWRDRLKEEFAKVARSELYLFAALDEFHGQHFLFGRYWHTCKGGVISLLAAPAGAGTANGTATQAGTPAARGGGGGV